MNAAILKANCLEASLKNEERTIFSSDDLSGIDLNHIPKHIALIPDGNRRWALLQELNPSKGHHVGADTVIEIVKAAKELGVKTLTFYVFSTENWNRPQEEVDALMWLLQTYLIDRRQTMMDSQIRLKTIGDLSKISEEVYQTISDTEKMTAACQSIDLVLAINYGGRDEIVRAFKKMAEDMNQGFFSSNEISESLISRYLDTTPWKDPDLLIRTSGEMRISNFLIWQLSYTEIYVEDVYWPDYTPYHLLQAIKSYQSRIRRLGK